MTLMPSQRYKMDLKLRLIVLYSFVWECINGVTSTNVVLMPASMVQDLINLEIVEDCDRQEGYFKCNGTSQCIHQEKNCDGFPDCENGSDEWECDDEANNEFWDHLFRKRPAAINDHLTHINCNGSELFTCKCRDTEVLCDNKGFTTIPQNFPANVTFLDLTGNKFPVLNVNNFTHLPPIERLVLKHCSIEVIEDGTFHKLKNNAFALHLDQNKIKRLPENLFAAGNWLHILILGGNEISELNVKTFQNLTFLEELDLRDNKIDKLDENTFKPLKNLKILYLNGNKMKQILLGTIPKLPLLETLSLAQNQIEVIESKALDLPSLKNLFLSGNRLRHIFNDTFSFLPNLLGLILSDNEIKTFDLNAFNGIENLTSMYLAGNLFRSLDKRVMKNLTNLQHIYFSEFQLCKSALHVRVCEPRGDGISSFGHLLDNPVLRGSVWIMASIAIIGNLLVLFGRYIVRHRHSQAHAEHSLYLRHLAASDFLMGVYLSIIATADFMFRGEYIHFEEEWRQSAVCALCGFLSTISCLSSTLLLTLVTWDRLISVTRPLYRRSSSKMRVSLRLVALWSLSSVAAGAPLSATEYFGNHFYGTNGVCLSIHIHDPYAMGWEYSAGLFIFINALSLLFIVFSYLKMLQAIRGSGEALRSTISGRENVVARRFAIIVATDCVCWMPVIIVKILALAGVKISPSLYAWLAVLVLPVNSALNPILFTLTTAQFKQQLTRFIYSLPCGVRGEQLNGYESGLDSRNVSLGQFTSLYGSKRLIQRRERVSTNTKVYEFR